MTTPDELEILNLRQALRDICLVEWPSKLKNNLPPVSLDVSIDDSGASPGNETRTIVLRPRTVGSAVRTNKWASTLALLKERPPPELAPFVEE